MTLTPIQKKIVFIIGVITVFSVCCIPHFYSRFIAIGIFNFALAYFLLKINPFKKIGIALIFSYFIISTPVIVYSLFIGLGEQIPGIISDIIYITSSVFAVIVYRSERKILFSAIYAVVFIFLTLNHNNMMNYYLKKENKMVGKTVPKIELTDAKGNKFFIQKNGKVQVVDLWSNACGYCIQAFPKFEKLKNDYKNDKEVILYAVNVKLDREDDIERAGKYLKKYSFVNYFTDRTICEKLNFRGIPQYVIIGKDGKIKYMGVLNIDKLETYNNIYNLIETEKGFE